MERLTEFEVKFSGLKEGVHKFDFSVTDKFFEEFEYKEFNSIQATVELNLHKKATLMEAHYSMQGQANLNCDLTNEPFDMKVAHQFDLVIKFGPDFSDDHEDLMVLPHGAHTYNASQHIYELLVLSIPQKRVHPVSSVGFIIAVGVNFRNVVFTYEFLYNFFWVTMTYLNLFTQFI